MKNKKLIETLSKLNPEAEVGYECLTIVRAHPDITGEYIDLSGESKIDKEKIGDTGVFIVVSSYVEMVANQEDGSVGSVKGTEVTAVYSTREKAEKMGKWLVSQNEWNGRKYTDYKIENFLILK